MVRLWLSCVLITLRICRIRNFLSMALFLFESKIPCFPWLLADEIAGRLDTAFAAASGSIFSTLREARGYSFERAVIARATGERFDSQVKAFRASEEFYIREQRLIALEESLQRIRKYVIVADKNDTETFIVDLKEKLTPSLYEIGGVQESSSQ